MLEEAVALKGQMCSVVFVSGTLVLLPFAVIMEGAQVRREGVLLVVVCWWLLCRRLLCWWFRRRGDIHSLPAHLPKL